jgi:hypothetical protein
MDKKKRKNIPKIIKNKVWDLCFGEDKGTGNCYVCQQKITSKCYDCGHVIASAKGGSDNVDNLKPVCHECNISMGTMNMNDFKKYIEENLKSKNDKVIEKEVKSDTFSDSFRKYIELMNGTQLFLMTRYIDLTFYECDKDLGLEFRNDIDNNKDNFIKIIMALSVTKLKILKKDFDSFITKKYMTSVTNRYGKLKHVLFHDEDCYKNPELMNDILKKDSVMTTTSKTEILKDNKYKMECCESCSFKKHIFCQSENPFIIKKEKTFDEIFLEYLNSLSSVQIYIIMKYMSLNLFDGCNEMTEKNVDYYEEHKDDLIKLIMSELSIDNLKELNEHIKKVFMTNKFITYAQDDEGNIIHITFHNNDKYQEIKEQDKILSESGDDDLSKWFNDTMNMCGIRTKFIDDHSYNGGCQGNCDGMVCRDHNILIHHNYFQIINPFCKT